MTAYIPKAKRGDWQTPDDVVALVREALGDIDLDPCASSDPADWFARENWDVVVNGLGRPWSFRGLHCSCACHLAPAPWVHPTPCCSLVDQPRPHCRVFCNPPFNELRTWAQRCAAEARAGSEVILLMPARTDTRAWHEDVASADAVCLWRGRMKFKGAVASCPFPVALVYWGQHADRFRSVFGPKGMVFEP